MSFLRNHIGAILVFALVGVFIVETVSRATGEESTPSVMTLEQAGGTAVTVGHIVAANLETGTESKFEMGAGTVACKRSKLEGKVTSNPEVKPDGSGVATIEIESFTFAECSSTVGGAGGTVEGLIADVPWIAKTDTVKHRWKISDSTSLQAELTMKLKKLSGDKLECSALSKVTAEYELGTAEFLLEHQFEAIIPRKGCTCEAPKWKAKYGPLQDETAGAKTVVMN